MILLSIVIRSWTRNLLSEYFIVESCLIVLECSWGLLIPPFLLLFVFLLNLFYDIIIFKIFFLYFSGHLFESLLSNTKSWLFNYKIWILLFLFNYFSSYVVVYQTVWSRRRIRIRLSDSFSISTGFKYGVLWFLIDDEFWIITSRSWLISWNNVLVFASCLSWSELPSVSPLYFVDKLVLHSISRFVITWTWDKFRCFTIN